MLDFSTTAAIPPGSGNVTINSGGAVAVSGAYTTIGGWLPNIAASSAGVSAISGADGEAVNMAGYASLGIGANGAATFSGSLTPAGATYRLGGGGGDLTVSTSLTGGNSLVAFGGGSGGTLLLTGNNTQSGPTTVNGGCLSYATASAVSPSSSILINAAGAVGVSGPQTTVAGWLATGLINPASTGALAVSGANDTETIDLSTTYSNYSGLSLGAVAAGATYSGALTPSGTTYRLGGGGPLTYTPAISGGYGLVADNTVILTAPASYTGPTTINAGTLQLANAASQTLVGNISGAGGLAYAGPGTLALTGSVNYTGPTTIAAGTLQLSGVANLSGNINAYALVVSGGTTTLSGNNTFSTAANPAVTVNGGVLSVSSLSRNLDHTQLGDVFTSPAARCWTRAPAPTTASAPTSSRATT